MLVLALVPAAHAETKTTTFADDCFWSIEKAFSRAGVVSAVSGFIGGSVKNPTYQQVVAGSS